MRQPCILAAFFICACTPEAENLSDIGDMEVSLGVQQSEVTLTLTRQSGPWKDCPVLTQETRLELDGQSIPLRSNGGGDDAGCHGHTVFAIPISQINPSRGTVATFTLKDATASMEFSVSAPMVGRALTWLEPANHTITSGTHVTLGWNGTLDNIQWHDSSVQGTYADRRVFDALPADEGNGQMGFTITQLPSSADGTGTVNASITYRRAVTSCTGFVSCVVPTETHQQALPVTFVP